MKYRKKYSTGLNILNLWLLIVATALPTQAQLCTDSPLSQPCAFTNALDFEGLPSCHISFDPVDERTPSDIIAKFDGLADFSISGGSAAIRHTSQHNTNYPGQGTEGGPVSGEWRIDWGYQETSTVSLVFATPVEAVGAFLGGDITGTTLVVTLEDGTIFTADRVSAGLDGVGDFLSSPTGECTAINGFLGVSSNGGSRIVQADYQETRDAASLDSIIFGWAVGGSHGAGPTLFPENAITTDCGALGFSLPPALPSDGLCPCVVSLGTTFEILSRASVQADW